MSMSYCRPPLYALEHKAQCQNESVNYYYEKVQPRELRLSAVRYQPTSLLETLYLRTYRLIPYARVHNSVI